jgi:hypothetical protein
MTSKVNINKNKLLTELCLKQRKKADKKYFLELNDLIRLLKNIDGNIFNKTDCVLWKGYLTKCNNNKSCYVNFYLKKRKLALHRILYINFIDDLDIKHYLKFTCDNPGKCCNINHILKVCEEDEKAVEVEQTNLINPTNQNNSINLNNPLELDLGQDKIQTATPSKKDISSNIKITKIDSNSKVGKIVIIFDD